jgi:glycosyltransferase involved in cell wall biosynthesis
LEGGTKGISGYLLQGILGIMSNKIRLAAFGFRSIPPREGCAGADKFASELYPRLVSLGHQVVGYNRLYPGQDPLGSNYKGVKLMNFKTCKKKGFDTLIHSMKCTFHIIFKNTGEVVHIQNGGNSIWAIFLRITGKKVFISQDGIDWSRDKWPWYGKVFLWMSAFITAYFPNQVIFDNIYARDLFETRFHKKFCFVPFGSEVDDFIEIEEIFEKLDIRRHDYFLFVGRFIPDKGLHYLIPAFERVKTNKKLVLVGGSPNPSDYEKQLHKTEDKRIFFAGYIYGVEILTLMKNAYCYVQPSDIEGLSPVILNLMGLGTPIICSDIRENIYAVSEDALLFKKGNIDSLTTALEISLNSYGQILMNAERAKSRALTTYNWSTVALEHEKYFMKARKFV